MNYIDINPKHHEIWLMFNEENYRQRHTRLGRQKSNKRITTTRKYNYPFSITVTKIKGITVTGEFLWF